ncbi:hypothetical protein MGYG_06448 [Nannizzia gypsea CBS 118893]|uniref:Uncharacterized protein n=1 Tax=Arthroderma gypseum (strain ATCC MYA-4604 / CBS 118893) TaxID=535722 RepID=E4UZC0_ARTGP|nr:hypothetical protein MGYG_06448 [Nannizzia gypsea CBS 118893]EFR03450.1 hypothetical protein MGYG_06448 [Nannizzia gypsea CBS 118893]
MQITHVIYNRMTYAKEGSPRSLAVNIDPVWKRYQRHREKKNKRFRFGRVLLECESHGGWEARRGIRPRQAESEKEQQTRGVFFFCTLKGIGAGIERRHQEHVIVENRIWSDRLTLAHREFGGFESKRKKKMKRQKRKKRRMKGKAKASKFHQAKQALYLHTGGLGLPKQNTSGGLSTATLTLLSMRDAPKQVNPCFKFLYTEYGHQAASGELILRIYDGFPR